VKDQYTNIPITNIPIHLVKGKEEEIVENIY